MLVEELRVQFVDVPMLHRRKAFERQRVAWPRSDTSKMAEIRSTTSRVAWPRSFEESYGAWAAYQRPNRGTHGGSPLLARRTRQTIVDHERQILEQIAEGFKVMPQERILGRIVEQCDEPFVSQFAEEILEVVQVTIPERVQQVQRRVAEHIVAVPGPLILERAIEVVRLFHISERISDQILVPRVVKQPLGVPNQRFVDVPVLQHLE